MKTITTPKGTAMWPFLKEAVSYNQTERKNLPDPEGSFLVDLVLSAEDAKPIMAQIDMALEESYKRCVEQRKGSKKKPERADAPYKEMEDDQGEVTDKMVFRFKLKAVGKNGKTGKTWKQRPPLFNCKGQPYPAGTDVWGGSVLKVAFEMNPYYMASTNKAGVSLRLKAVQIIDLVTGGEKTADAFGFGEEEGTANSVPTEEVAEELVMAMDSEDF